MTESLSGAWQVLILYLIPIGGGIPAGVLLAKSRGFHWPTMTALYFLSDIILACVFEPCVILIGFAAKKYPALARTVEAFKKATQQMIDKYGVKPGPFSLIAIAFGVDPMTGRTAALAAGHGFISGWFLAICGDMIYFSVLMVSTLFLNNILGNGTWATIIIMVIMLFAPAFFRKVASFFKPTTPRP